MTAIMKILPYEIHQCTGFQGRYIPDNIMDDCPSDQSSRWSSDSNTPTQFITIRLRNTAIVKRIKFGKFERHHVCNLKRFRINGGLSERSMVKLAENGLKDDPVPEIFPLRHKIDAEPFACNFLQIVALQSWGPTYNFSIWYIQLFGDDNDELVQRSIENFNQYRENKALKMCLKYLRDTKNADLYQELESRTGIQLEHEIISRLHSALIVRQDLAATEKLLHEANKAGYFDDYVENENYAPKWTQLTNCSTVSNLPGVRGGHQMVIDALMDIIYLFGGWDGGADLADFWSYNIQTNQWKCISIDTSEDGGPSPRSCHRMVMDSANQQIFILGKYLEPEVRTTENVVSDFFVYHIPSCSWQLITDNTNAEGGPPPIYEHQMAIDIDRQIIYCFGGRILNVSDGKDGRCGLFDICVDTSVDGQFSGLYAYNIPTNSWCLLRDNSSNMDGLMKARTGHSMLFCPVNRKLYVFAGQRNNQLLTDFIAYDVDEDSASTVVDADGAVVTIPLMGSTLRATIDPQKQEIYVLSGSLRAKTKETAVKNALWVYNVSSGTWSCVFENETSDLNVCKDQLPTNREQMLNAIRLRRQMQQQPREPCPRYAHQLVYDSNRQVHYLFGGNPGRPQTFGYGARLDDFWELKLVKPTCSNILAECQWHIRESIWKELAVNDVSKAVEYLQNELASITDQTDPLQIDMLQQLANSLFVKSETVSNSRAQRRERNEALFIFLIKFFPPKMRPPSQNLVDLVSI